MDTTRQQKINRLLQKELSILFQREAQGLHGMIISVTNVKTSPDLSTTKIYLSIFPANKKEETLKDIKANTKTLRYQLAKKVGKQLRVIPELTFFPDDTLDYAEKIDKLLDKIN